MSTFRRRVELRAGPALVLASRLPKVVPFLVVGGLLLAGLMTTGGVSAALLLLLAALLGTLLFLAWPALPQQGRLLRLTVVAMVAATAVGRLV